MVTSEYEGHGTASTYWKRCSIFGSFGIYTRITPVKSKPPDLCQQNPQILSL